MNEPVLLLLSANSGTGHRRAGEKLATELKGRFPHWEIRHEDLCNYASPLQRWIIERLWLIASTQPVLRTLYGVLHHWVISNALISRIFSWWYLPVARALERNYAHCEIAGVIALHPGAVCAGVAWKRRVDFYLGVIATDLVVHNLQTLGGVDRIFAHRLSQVIGKASAHDGYVGKIVFSGIPSNVCKSNIWVDNCNNKRVLVTFGASGLGASVRMRKVMEILCENDELEADIVCGYDLELRRYVDELVRKHDLCERVTVIGLCEDMAERIRSADLIVGKAGGMSVCEAIDANKPMLLLEILPGQEVYNARALERSGRRIFISHSSEINGILQEYSRVDNGMSTMAGEMDGCTAIVHQIDFDLSQRRSIVHEMAASPPLTGRGDVEVRVGA